MNNESIADKIVMVYDYGKQGRTTIILRKDPTNCIDVDTLNRIIKPYGYKIMEGF